MAEKQLTESAWKAFAKGKSLDDAALLKAFAALAKADEDAKARVKALDGIDSAITALRKSAKGDKALSSHLDDLASAAGRARKEAGQAGDDEESPVLLTDKMLPLVREIRAGEVTMPALISMAGKATAVLILRQGMSPSRRKLMVEALGGASGVKHVEAACTLEAGQLTFIVQGQASGMAKRIREALLEQLKLRLKVRVRGDDGQIELDGDDAAEVDGEVLQPKGDTAGSGGSVDRIRFDQVLALLRTRIDQALAQQHPQAGKLRAVEGFAREKADAGDIAAAIKSLGMLKQLLDAPTPEPGSGGRQTAVDPAAREQAMADWRATRDATVKMLKALAAEVAASGFVDARGAVIELTAVVKQLTTEPATRQQVSELMTWLGDDEVVADVDEMAENIRDPLMQRLRAIEATLPAN